MKERVKRIGEENRKPFKRLKKKKKKNEKIEFHSSIQDWVFTTVYRLRKVHGKMTGTILSEIKLGKSFPSLNWKGVVWS